MDDGETGRRVGNRACDDQANRDGESEKYGGEAHDEEM